MLSDQRSSQLYFAEATFEILALVCAQALQALSQRIAGRLREYCPAVDAAFSSAHGELPRPEVAGCPAGEAWRHTAGLSRFGTNHVGCKELQWMYPV